MKSEYFKILIASKMWDTHVRANLSKFCSEISMVFILADFLANFYKFQIFVEQSIFVVYKRLLYKKTSIFDGECNRIKRN